MRWSETLRWADLQAYVQWAYFDALIDGFTGDASEGFGSLLLHWLTNLRPGADDVVEFLRRQRETAVELVLSENRKIADKVVIEMR